MFVKYGKGKDGIVEYLKNGQSKSRDFNRDELDDRLTLFGDIDELDFVLKKYKKKINSKNNGDNYKHFVITFKEKDVSLDVIKKITEEFKLFSTSGYKDNELYFYAEVHQPKIKGYPFKNGEYNERKPHVHVIIPVYNLITGTKQYNFNYKLFNYNSYLKIFNKLMNYKFNLDSPYELENKKLLNAASKQISRKNNNLFFDNNLNIKEKILLDIIKLEISNKYDLTKYLKTNYNNYLIKNGDINSNILILKNSENEIILNDFCFSEEFLKLENSKKKFLYEKTKNDSENNNKVFNSDLTELEKNELDEYFKFYSKKIKYSKTIKNFNEFKNCEISEQKKIIKIEEEKFYKRINYGRKDRRDQKNNFGKLRETARSFELICKNISKSRNHYEESIKLAKSIKLENTGYKLKNTVKNKLLEIKFGCHPNNTFEHNFNSLTHEQKSNFFKIISDKNNIKELIKINEKRLNISNFYIKNKDINNFLIDGFLNWNKQSTKEKVKLTKETIYKEEFNYFLNLKNEYEEKYKKEKIFIENKFKYATKLKRKELKSLKEKYNLIIKNISKSEKVFVSDCVKGNKKSIKDETIVSDNFINYLSSELILTRNKEIAEEIKSYIKLVNICKNKTTEEQINNLFIDKKQIIEIER